jgi:MFS family permease
MACAEDWEVGLMGAMFFFGWSLSLVFISRSSDRFGRQKWTQAAGIA